MPEFRPISLGEFLAQKIPARAPLLGPIAEKSLSMLYAPRGVGKTLIGLSIGAAVASGSKLFGWQSPRPGRVLYIDGEMPLADLQSRLAAITRGKNISADGFRILAADHTEAGIDLASATGQAAIESLLDGVDLLVVDNLSTLCASGSEAASDAWLPMQNWLLQLRRRGVAVLIIHHAGLNGRQRGTSRREDTLDAVIALRRPANYSPGEGARFEVHVEKMRLRSNFDMTPFEAQGQTVPGETGDKLVWKRSSLAPSVEKRAATLFAAGKTVREVAAALNISKSAAGRLKLLSAEPRAEEHPDGDESETLPPSTRKLN
jgi:putative DNA primase/helicase